MTPSPSPFAIADRRRAFRALHASGCFVLPNPWDAGSARYLESLGFKALATTSSGFAWSHARADGAMPRDAVLAHLREIVFALRVSLWSDKPPTAYAPAPQEWKDAAKAAGRKPDVDTLVDMVWPR